MPENAIDLLSTNLRFHNGWVTLCRGYLRRQQKPLVAAFLQRMLDTELEAVEILAHTLRQHGIVVTEIGVQEDLVANGLARRSVRACLEYIQIGLTRSLNWYDERLTQTDATLTEVWSTLRSTHQDLRTALNDLLSFLTSPEAA